MNETTKDINFDVVERERLYAVCDELSLGMSGLIDPAMDSVNGKRGLITTMEGRRKGAR